jgi:hypothetical protein
MEITTPNATRRSTRLRVQIPLTVTSLDRIHPFSARCVALVVSAQGCGFQASQALPLETPLLLSDLPGGASASGRVANCLPLGKDGKQFLIGVALYNHGNVWGIANPPDDWNNVSHSTNASATATKNPPTQSKDVWPYNLFSGHSEARPGRK